VYVLYFYIKAKSEEMVNGGTQHIKNVLSDDSYVKNYIKN